MKVFDKNGQLLYDINESKEIARGGEGRVLDLDANHVVKLYLPNVKPIAESKFLELHKLDNPMFIKPESLLYDANKHVLGFSMRKIPSDFFPLVSLLNKVFCNRESITLDTKKKVIEALIQGVKYAHSNQVVIGDLNPYNILINRDGIVYFIDTDSFQTPGFKHSGVLLEDVRDFLFNGDVSINSDYFALSILVFNMLTYVHPFKGMHKKIPKIADRMIKKESILSNSPDIIIPKCYEPISDNMLLNQFNRVFNNGERFIISLNTLIINTVIKQPVNIQSANMTVRTMFGGVGTQIIQSAASKDLLLLYTVRGEYFIYNTSLKGTATLVKSDKITAKNPKFFVYEKAIYCLNSNGNLLQLYPKLEHIASVPSTIKIKADLYGSNLVLVTEDKLYNFDLSKSLLGLSYTITSVYGRGFTQIDSIYQSVSGKTVLMYYEKNSLNYVMADIAIKNIIQRGNLVLLEEIANEKVTYQYASISNLKLTYLASETELKYFDVLNNDLAVIPYDNKIQFARLLDMNPILEFDCSVASANSIIHCTNAGIVIVNNDACYLTNKR